jgi:hypothetical protein
MLQWIKRLANPCRRSFIASIAIATLAGPTLVLAQDAVAPRPQQRQAVVNPPYAMNDVGPKFTPGKPHVVVIDAGGTLTARARDRISYLHYQGSVQGGVQTILSDLYPELAAVANVSVVHAGGLGGSSAVKNATLYNIS